MNSKRFALKKNKKHIYIHTYHLNSFTGHISPKHKHHTLRDFRTSVRVGSGVQSNDTDQPSNDGAKKGFSLTDRPTLDDETDCVENADADILEHKVASFFLRI